MRNTIVSAFLSVFVLTGAAAVLSACNTVEGAGKDVSAAGRTMTDTSREVRR